MHTHAGVRAGAGGGAARPRSATCSSTRPARPRTTSACASWPCAGACRCPSTASPAPDGTATHADEDAVYAALGLHPIPPELREDAGEIDAALAGPLPALVTREDLRGELHAHTTWSDGTESVAAMVEAARARGYRYLAISDHSQSLAMAGGLDRDRVRRQWEEIAAVDARHDDITVLRATEVDILADGRLDFDDALLAGFDWVTASMHSGLTQDAARITARVMAAVASPFVDTIGHPTGRMLGRREAAPVDIDRVAGRRGGDRDLPGGQRPAAPPRPRLRHGPAGARGGRAADDRRRRALGRGPRPGALRGAGGPPRGRAPARTSATRGTGRSSRRRGPARLAAAGVSPADYA